MKGQTGKIILTPETATHMAELFQAVADGEIIQYYSDDYKGWVDCYDKSTKVFYVVNFYDVLYGKHRIKPKEQILYLGETKLSVVKNNIEEYTEDCVTDIEFFQFSAGRYAPFKKPENNRYIDLILEGATISSKDLFDTFYKKGYTITEINGIPFNI